MHRHRGPSDLARRCDGCANERRGQADRQRVPPTRQPRLLGGPALGPGPTGRMALVVGCRGHGGRFAHRAAPVCPVSGHRCPRKAGLQPRPSAATSATCWPRNRQALEHDPASRRRGASAQSRPPTTPHAEHRRLWRFAGSQRQEKGRPEEKGLLGPGFAGCSGVWTSAAAETISSSSAWSFRTSSSPHRGELTR